MVLQAAQNGLDDDDGRYGAEKNIIRACTVEQAIKLVEFFNRQKQALLGLWEPDQPAPTVREIPMVIKFIHRITANNFLS